MCQGAIPFIVRVIMDLLIVYCQLLHESHHHLELLVFKKAMVIGKLLVSFVNHIAHGCSDSIMKVLFLPYSRSL